MADLCASFQEEALGQLVRKLTSALSGRAVDSILVAGGVAANLRFHELMADAVQIPVYFSSPALLVDNVKL